MKKQNIKTIITLVIWGLLLILIPNLVKVVEENQNKNNTSYISSDFNIEKYDITLDIDRDRKIDVTEVITIDIPKDNFNGIYKSIPTWQTYNTELNQEKEKRVVITNLRAIGEKFELTEKNNKIGIQIGSRRTKIKPGLHTYTIKYRYNMGKDTNESFDDLIFNVFDNYDDTKINNINITVNSFENIEDAEIEFINKDKNITSRVVHQKEGKTLTASLTDYELENSLTMNMKFKDNYFRGGTNNYGIICLTVCVLIILIAVGSFIAWLKHGKDYNKYTHTVEFYPPEGLDAAQLGFISGETSISKLVTSLLVSLAYKGYISIKEHNGYFEINNIGHNKKDLKPLSITEQMVYQEIFISSDKITSNDPLMHNALVKVGSYIKEITNKKVNDINANKLMNTVSGLLILSTIIWTLAYLFINDLNPDLNSLYAISFISIFIIGLFSIIMDRKTSYGEMISARIKGFKNYLVTAEKMTLNIQVDKNPEYFYEILPYTYALGVSKKWMKKFNKASMPNIDLKNLETYESELFMIID